ncbi:unnamed protein product [Leptosia nina]|uniref:Uncharacterized protein n=1 Tax=Leptosia nina TaxID=320188 RepID=A0AAV1JKT1_9NEOP
MHFKEICFLVTLTVMFIHDVKALPRDSSVIKTESVSSIQDTSLPKVKEPSKESAMVIPGQVICKNDKESEEPAEDVICQEHCLPKGYSYGICVSGKCSCI